MMQLAVTALSAIVALVSATITASTFRAAQRDRIRSDVDELTVAISDAWKLSKAIDRAVAAFDPMIEVAERERLRISAAAEFNSVVARSIWPAKLDKALVDGRRIVEDTPAATSQRRLESAAARYRLVSRDVLEGTGTLQAMLKAKSRKLSPKVPSRWARGDALIQDSIFLSARAPRGEPKSSAE